jgi:hypothetical protein
MKKKIVVLLMAVVSLAMSSCSFYSCPTYSKVVKDEPGHKTKI